jgi:hypothetical protein
MLHAILTTRFLEELAKPGPTAAVLSEDGAIQIRLEGGFFGPGLIEIRCPQGLEDDVAQTIQTLDRVARVPLFVGVAAMGQPTGLSRVDARLRIDPVHQEPGLVRMPFYLEMGW